MDYGGIRTRLGQCTPPRPARGDTYRSCTVSAVRSDARRTVCPSPLLPARSARSRVRSGQVRSGPERLGLWSGRACSAPSTHVYSIYTAAAVAAALAITCSTSKYRMKQQFITVVKHKIASKHLFRYIHCAAIYSIGYTY